MKLTNKQKQTIFLHRTLLVLVILAIYNLLWQILEAITNTAETNIIVKVIILLSFLPFIQFFVNRFIRFVKFQVVKDENGNTIFREMNMEDADE